MDKKEYLHIQKAARRSKVNLYASVVYLVLFILLAGYVFSYVAPHFYYAKMDGERLIVEKDKVPDYSEEGLVSYSKREKYRKYWFEVTQTNKRYSPIMNQEKMAPFGKESSYLVSKQVGAQNMKVAEVTEHYVFGQLRSIEIDNYENEDNQLARLLNMNRPLTGISLDDLIAVIKGQGEYTVINVQVLFKVAKSRETIDSYFDLAKNSWGPGKGELELLRYGVSGIGSSSAMMSFGYPAYEHNYQGYEQISEEVFLDRLTYLSDHYEDFGELLLDNPKNLKQPSAEQIKEKVTNQQEYGGALFQLADSPFDFYTIEEGLPRDTAYFAEQLTYLQKNGITYNSVTLTGTGVELSKWLTANKNDIMRVEIQEMTNWNYATIGSE
ncbi:hypothetical protein I6N95_12740 [Vagococcus sp. BWB3-3]|uniref:Sigma factor regulator C-terminal domain-containing protein n=1 Tax=Vagococcus allomyrinae TaxID=2794353 RepID=A0A940SVI2_9ENTE|nr:hypothetical protein [Vagococcus allomyrinae]MBP1041879.1 hypothetical protein [Vagococcus allomyrinae]